MFIPTQVLSNGAERVSCGFDHSIFVIGTSLWGTGRNRYGELGDGTTNTSYVPEEILASSRFVKVFSICAGTENTLFDTDNGLGTSGALRGIGANGGYELGDGTTNTPLTPEVIFSTNHTAVLAIACGPQHTLFIQHDGSLWGMGLNKYGQLGNNPATNKVPVLVSGAVVTAIAAGNFHSLFIMSDGSLWAMGLDQYGELGDGGSQSVFSPEQIEPGGIVAVAAGGNQSLFIKSDGSLWGMGDNSLGQLGLGALSSTSTPQQIVASNVVAVSAGADDTLFIKSDGSLWGMGLNNFGELGTGDVTKRTTPVQIVGPVPQILTHLNGSTFALSWGTNSPGFTLQATASLSSPNWTNVMTTPVIIGDQYVVSNTPTGQQGFYRLSQ